MVPRQEGLKSFIITKIFHCIFLLTHDGHVGVLHESKVARGDSDLTHVGSRKVDLDIFDHDPSLPRGSHLKRMKNHIFFADLISKMAAAELPFPAGRFRTTSGKEKTVLRMSFLVDLELRAKKEPLVREKKPKSERAINWP